MDVNGGLNADGSVAAYDFATRYPSNGAPTLALLLTGRIAPEPAVFEMGDRTAIPPYDYDHLRVVANDMPPIVRASWLRGVSALPNTFAHESYIDELATEAGVDPIEYRLRYLKDARAVDLVNAVAERAGWKPRPVRQEAKPRATSCAAAALPMRAMCTASSRATARRGRPGWPTSRSTRRPARSASRRVVAGQDSGLMINPAGVRHQIHGNVIQSTSRALMEEVSFDRARGDGREWGAYPIIKFPEVPEIEVLMLPRQDQPPLGVGESASVPSAAAIANAIFDATGVRFRELPFTPERILRGLHGEATVAPEALPAPPPAPDLSQMAKPVCRTARRAGDGGGTMRGVIGIGAAVLPWRAIAPIARPDASVYSAATIARGQQLAALGDCAVCHTAPSGVLNAGGRAMRDAVRHHLQHQHHARRRNRHRRVVLPAFERAMREGIHRDGKHLYPAFPYTHFAKTTDADLQALYAYLMAQPPVRAETPANELAFPFNMRPLMAGWNALFHQPGPFQARCEQIRRYGIAAPIWSKASAIAAPATRRATRWARRRRSAYLAGGFAEGWEAPALTSLSQAPMPWSEDELYAYLRTGESRLHGVAAGPMAPVVKELAALPDQDIRAMAVYLASFNETATDKPAQEALAAKLEAATSTRLVAASSVGARIYQGACAVCHEVGGAPLFGSRPSLALNSNLHSAVPDNLIQVILHGIKAPVTSDLGYMPAFKDSLTDGQVAELAAYLRRQFAPDRPGWSDIHAAVGPNPAGNGALSCHAAGQNPLVGPLAAR